MGRWDVFNRDSSRDTDVGLAREPRPEESNAVSVSVGRGPTENTSAESPERPDRTEQRSAARAPERRSQHQDRGRTYSLRASEIATMTEIGRFRTLDVRDLARFVYGKDETRLKYDLESLRTQGLIEEKTFFRSHKTPRRLVTLTEDGHRMIRKVIGSSPQRMYCGFVKPKELDHDADLYRVYQKASEEIRERGGKPTRVRLDFELKELINRAKQTAGRLREDQRQRFLSAAANEHGLSIDGVTIHLPDVQIEYESRDGSIERQNLELLSRNYREQGIRGKAAAGFKLYARGGDANRVRRALHDTGMVREVLSI